MKKFFILLLLSICSITALPQQKVIIRFSNPDPVLVKHFAAENYDIAAYYPGSFLDLFVTETEYAHLQQLGYSASIIQTEAEMRSNLKGDNDINGYLNYEQSLEELQQMVVDHPDICQLFDIGDSRGKIYFNQGNQNYVDYQHEIWALKVSDNVEEDEDEAAIFYMGAHHAREPLSTMVAFYVLNHILDNYGTDPQITENVNSKELWFIPVVNPDGQKIVLDEIDVSWRKNIRDNDNNNQITWSGGWSYPDGVDPNRNYGWEFGGEGASPDPGDQTYHGPEAFSEPEIAALRDLMAQRHFVAGISYHTYSELVLWPYGYTSNANGPDAAALAALGTAMGESIPALGSGHYTPQPSWALYPAAGGTDDYAYGKHGIFSYTIELATQFIPPANQVPGICEDNLEAAMILLNRVNTSTLTGLITNSATNEPVIAEIFVQGIDNTGLFKEPYISDEAFGRYYRMLPNGDYSVTFSAYGYISQTFDNVNINNAGQTILDVALEQSQVIEVTGVVTDIDTGDPIANASVEVLGTPLEPVYTNNNGEYIIGEIYENTYTFRVWAENYAVLTQEITVSPENTIANFELTESTAVSFEAGVFPPGWSFAGNADWTISNTASWDGLYSARSGAIGDNQTSQLIITLTVANDGEISFYRKVSSESGYDFLQFFINGVLKDQWSGEINWSAVSYPVTAGENTFKWVYEKDVYVSSGQDCGWIDYIVLPPAATLSANAGPNGQICEGTSFQCEGSAAFYSSVEWTSAGDGQFSNPDILTPEYTPGNNDIETGSVVLTLTAYGNEGTSVSDDLTLTIDPLPEPGTEITGDNNCCAGSIELYSCESIPFAENYEWSLIPVEAGIVQSQNNTEITIAWAEDYFGTATLKVRGENNCGYGNYSEDFIITINDCTGLTEQGNNHFTIYPNPVNDYLLIFKEKGSSEKTSVKILNLLGEIVFQQIVFQSNMEPIQISTADLPSGIFFLTISDRKQFYTKKLIIQRN